MRPGRNLKVSSLHKANKDLLLQAKSPEMLRSYFNLSLKCMENTFEALGIKYLFKPVETHDSQKKTLLNSLDSLKHAYGLICFT